MKKIYIILGMVLAGFSLVFAQKNTAAREVLEQYIQAWFSLDNENDWFFEVNDLKFPKQGIAYGLKVLDESLKSNKVSKEDRKKIRQRYIDTYVDQSMIFALSYKDLLDSDELDYLMQEFFRQAAAQIWLEKQIQKNPQAIVPTKQEIDEYYARHSARLIALGLSASQIKEYTEQELKQQKLQLWTQEEMKKAKASTKIKFNKAVEKELGIK